MDFPHTNWKKYFVSRHEGLGTTYERFVLHNHFRRLQTGYDIETVLEAPVFGMTGISGINSMWWAIRGANVTLVDHNRERLDAIRRVWHEMSLNVRLVYDSGGYVSLPFGDQQFDMGWNFAALDTALEFEGLLRELPRVTRKVIFICVPNRWNLFSLICKSMLKRSQRRQIVRIYPGSIEKVLGKFGWRIREKGYFDVPPWPDIAMGKVDFFRKIGLTRYATQLEREITSENRLSILDYYSGAKKEVKKRALKYDFLENSPTLLKRIWAHHQYYLFEPRII